jgi:hypothetical protein
MELKLIICSDPKKTNRNSGFKNNGKPEKYFPLAK